MRIYLIRHNVNKKLEGMEDLATTSLDYNNGKFNILETKGIEFGEKI